MAAWFEQQTAAFAAAVTAAFALPVRANPEEQLKAPVMELLRGAGAGLGLVVQTVPEAQVAAVGRPDIAATVGGLLAGYVELKRPGKGADANRLDGRDKAQWEKFKNLPNLLYSDGNEWALYRSGVRFGALVRFPGDLSREGAAAVGAAETAALLNLLRDFLFWQPSVPNTPRALADILAPLARLLREEVQSALADPASNLSLLAEDWRRYFFPDADDAQFADAYAQTLTYALLLARLAGAQELTIDRAVQTIRRGHHLLADTLKILGDEQARESIAVPLNLLERVIAAVEVDTLTEQREQDLWLYFYEDFLAAYDPRMRRDRGVYYTPVPVVQCQVRLVSQVLAERFGAARGFVDAGVQTLDPATGTGTYLLAAIRHGLEQVEARRGPGARAAAATTAAANSHAFELLVGPYAVAHLRLTQLIRAEGGELPADGPHIYLTDTLDAPHGVPPQPPLLYRQLTDEYRRAQRIKSQQTPILVCIGNPPYDRQQLAPEEEQAGNKRKGGWVRFGDAGRDQPGILDDFIAPLRAMELGVHAKNLYNDYVYFWRWALWKVLESAPERGGIVSFITASSYLRGPGFAGMRQVMRQSFDELWIIDLEGDDLGARKSENVFAIRSPVAIALGVRHGPPRPDQPATVRYTRLTGSREAKLEALERVHSFQDLPWRDCLSGWSDPFLPTSAHNPYWAWPLLTDLFPWQQNGVQFKRTWPIAETQETLSERWAALLAAPPANRAALLRSTPARTVQRPGTRYDGDPTPLPALAALPGDAPPVPPSRYAYRSFDRRWTLLDDRLADRPRPDLLLAHGPRQLYLTSLLTNVLGEGPAAVVTNLVPDLDHFRGSFGARHVIPLWRDRAGTEANVVTGLLARLTATYGRPVTPEQFFAYAYALLATPHYVARFWDELTLPGLRLPITREAAHFAAAVALGERLIWLHTFGERCVPPGQRAGELPQGQARILVATPQSEAAYPNEFHYDAATHTLHVSGGQIAPVAPEVWEFSISGLRVVDSWLAYRMRERKGKASSPLDAIRPRCWSFDNDLLDLLWLLEGTLALLPDARALLDTILAGDLFTADELPTPAPWEREARRGDRAGMLPLFDD